MSDVFAMLNAGKDLASILQILEVSGSIYQRWLDQYDDMKSEEAKRIKQLSSITRLP